MTDLPIIDQSTSINTFVTGGIKEINPNGMYSNPPLIADSPCNCDNCNAHINDIEVVLTENDVPENSVPKTSSGKIYRITNEHLLKVAIGTAFLGIIYVAIKK